MTDKRLEQQIRFLKEVDGLKSVIRQTTLMDGSRGENSAEHSWHIALMILLLAEYSARPIEVSRAINIAIIHDLVEVYAGDTFYYDEKARREKDEKEKDAAEKLFGLLPDDLRNFVHSLWLEYEECQTAEAQFVRVIDRLQPFLCNYETQGHSWKKHNVSKEEVRNRMRLWYKFAPRLGEMVEKMIEEPGAKKFFA